MREIIARALIGVSDCALVPVPRVASAIVSNQINREGELRSDQTDRRTSAVEMKRKNRGGSDNVCSAEDRSI